MNHLELWKLATDTLLLLALGCLCFQFARSPRISAASRQLRELEGALRALIREADGAGRTLNEQLMQRQASLEKLLIDAQLTEQRITQASASSRIEESRVSSRSEPDYERPAASRAKKVSTSRPAGPVIMEETVEPASFPARPAQRPLESSAEEEEESTITFGATNIYGEPIESKPAPAPSEPVIGKAQQRAMETYSPLKAKIEKEVKASAKNAAAKGSLEDLYASAEQLLRAGNDLMAVANRTKLPIEEVRALSQMIIGERAVAENNARQSGTTEIEDDPRLGVMTKMKRQTITL